jgi:hypothetical protein
MDPLPAKEGKMLQMFLVEQARRKSELMCVE